MIPQPQSVCKHFLGNFHAGTMQAVGLLTYLVLSVRSEISRGAEDSISRATLKAITCSAFLQQGDLWEAVFVSHVYL